MAAGNEQATITEPVVELNDDQVRDYLKNNEDFLQRNPDMLDYLHISHATGSAVSLVEKQVSVLRERNVEMRHRLNHLTANARENDRLYSHTRAMVLALMDARDIVGLNAAFHRAMKNDFKVEHASLILFGTPEDGIECRIEPLESAKIEVGALLRSHKPVCGVLREEELRYLFPNAVGVGSAALMPLTGSDELGLIAVGSTDPNRYSSSTGTLFLAHIADVVVRLLPRLQLTS